MGFSRQEYWNGLPFPSTGDLPVPGIDLGLLHCRQSLYCLSHFQCELQILGPSLSGMKITVATIRHIYQFSSAQFSCSVVSNSLWPHEPQMAGLPVHHQLPEFTQTHIHWVGDAIQPSHPLSSPSPPALNISQHQGLFKRVSSSHQVAKVLEFQLQHQSFQWTLRTDLL